MRLYLKLRGEKGHSYPKLTLKQNEKVLEFEIVDNKEIDLDLDNANFTLGMYDKLFGKNQIWDTIIDSENNIVADKVIYIDRFEIDGVDIVHLFPKLTYESVEHGYMTIHDACIRFNGDWKFPIEDNPYDWIIDMNNQQTNEYRDTSYFSDYTIVGNYSDHYRYMNKIRKLLDI